MPLMAIPPSFWNAPPGSGKLYAEIIAALVVGCLICFGMSKAGPMTRRYFVGGFTFLAGAFYVAYYLWPAPINYQTQLHEVPRNFSEQIGFFLADALPLVADFTNILTAFLLGLGVYSVLRIHVTRLVKMQTDWAFSAVLLAAMGLMSVFGLWDWAQRQKNPNLDMQSNWGFVNYFSDILFNGFLQQMDAAMFSIIAFYILSAAYRAFRVRSIEATILLATALIVMLSLLGGVDAAWSGAVKNVGHFNNVADANWTLTSIARWITKSVQTASLRGIDFGVGIGSLAMGLRLWLSLEKQGGN